MVDSRVHGELGSMAESYAAVPASVPLARQAVVALAVRAGAGEEQLEAIRLATSEALTNAVVHAYEGAPGKIHVSAEAGRDAVSVSVADDGAGLRPRLERQGMGIGLALIAEATDELTIRKRPAGGTELQMRFAVSPRS
jgi:anti-sigma regulatory factor (Ser/Thr protein kinase)